MALPCPKGVGAVDLAGITLSDAVVLCADGTVFATADGGAIWRVAGCRRRGANRSRGAGLRRDGRDALGRPGHVDLPHRRHDLGARRGVGPDIPCLR